MSSISFCDSADGALIDPRVQRLKRSETYHAEPLSAATSAPIPPPKDRYFLRGNLKRAPSYGAVKQEAKLQHQRKKDTDNLSPSSAPVTMDANQPRHERKFSSGSHISSDEEEKVRSKKRVKKLKTTSGRISSSPVPSSPTSASSSSDAIGNGTDTALSPPIVRVLTEKKLPSVPRIRSKSPKSTSIVPGAIESRRILRSNLNLSRGDEACMKEVAMASNNTKAVSSPTNLKSKASSNRPSTRPVPMNLQRNPSMFGEELPMLPKLGVVEGIGKSKGGETSVKKDTIRSPVPVSPVASKCAVKSPTPSSGSPASRTLRRVKRLDLGLGFGLGARKIEFGKDDTKEPGKGNVPQGLESAIQLI